MNVGLYVFTMVSRDKCILAWLMFTVAAFALNDGPRCPSESSELCQEADSAVDEYYYIIEGQKITITFGAVYFFFICSGNVTLESDYLPRFTQRTDIEKVKLTSCPPPEGGYAAALLNFNVTARACLELDQVPSSPALSSRHFEGLRVRALTLYGVNDRAPMRPDSDFLTPLAANLRDLKLANALVPLQTLHALSPDILALSLRRTGLDLLPPERLAAALARLPQLQLLVLQEKALSELILRPTSANEGKALTLFAEAPLTALAPGRAENVTLKGALDVTMRGDCDALRRLEMTDAKAVLPVGWLARCPLVAELSLQRMPAGAAGHAELRGAKALRSLHVNTCRLRELPPDWLEDAADLAELDLSYNEIETFPAGLLAKNLRLRTLRLQNNRLTNLQPELLGPLPALAVLDLARNPLGDMCGSGGSFVTHGLSPLRGLRRLRELRLARTGARGVCRDWRALPRLALVDLSHNNVSQLAFSDLVWAEANVELVLDGNKITTLEYTAEEYKRAVRDNGTVLSLSLSADWALDCDCRDYWAARALRERPAHALTLLRARCGAGSAGVGLADRNPDDFMCEVTDEGACPAGCRCAVHATATALECAGALPTPPLPRLLPPVRRVRVRGGLRELKPDLLTANLTVLDLANNSLSRVSAETAALLFAAPQRVVWLADNPWECDCDSLPLLRTVVLHVARVPDVARARCAGRALLAAAAALDAQCTSWAVSAWAWAPAALALAAAGAVLALAATRPALRRRVKGFLFARGLCVRWLLRPFDADEAPDASRPYDAFVSFSHHDAAYAMELSAQLEGEAGLRLCLHERDWTPGEWIPAQIAASVRAARRTLVLLSDSFLRSQWARAEFREAYSAALSEQRPRLLLLLLPGVSAAALAALSAEPELRAYLARVTYLRWDDPRFWTKLRLALPANANAPATAPAAA